MNGNYYKLNTTNKPSTEFDLKMANKWPKKSAFRFSFCNIAGNQTLGSLLCQ